MTNSTTGGEPRQPSLDDRAGLATYILQVLACPTLSEEQKNAQVAEAEASLAHLAANENIAAHRAAGLWNWREERILDAEAR
jgi:hypothetical protein